MLLKSGSERKEREEQPKSKLNEVASKNFASSILLVYNSSPRYEPSSLSLSLSLGSRMHFSERVRVFLRVRVKRISARDLNCSLLETNERDLEISFEVRSLREATLFLFSLFLLFLSLSSLSLLSFISTHTRSLVSTPAYSILLFSPNSQSKHLLSTSTSQTLSLTKLYHFSLSPPLLPDPNFPFS